MRHPDPDELAAFAGGELGGHKREALERHLDTCKDCVEVVAALARAFSSADSIGDTADDDAPASRGPAVGAKLERFHILEEVGRGAMGVVFAAYDPDLDRRVALKVLREAGSDVRFLREAQAMARLSHPNVITVHEARVVDGRLYVSMEYIDGTTLRGWLQAQPRTWSDVVGVFVQVARGLAAAHAAGLVHRDIKPDNVLIGGDGRARVTDFGLARPAGIPATDTDGRSPTVDALGTELTQAGALVGTPAYMSPEQLRGDTAGPASDQFGFCVAFHEALFGERPFDGTGLTELAANVLADRRREPPGDRPVPRWLKHAVSRGLAPEPDARHPSMAVLVRLLERGDRSKQRRRQIALLVGALAVGGTLVAAIEAFSDPVCSGADERLAGVWDPARKTEVRASLLAVDRPYAEATWRRTQSVLDDYRSAWIAGYVDACEATNVRQTQSDVLLDARMRCLERQRDRLTALVDVFAAADDDVLQNASNAVDALPAIATCADTELVTREVPLPDGAQARERAAGLRVQLAQAQALETAGKYADGIDLVRTIQVAADDLADRPLQAEVLLRLGSLLDRQGEFADATTTLEEALWLARASGHDDVARDATIALVNSTLGEQGTSAVALRWARAAWAEIEWRGGDAARAELLLVEGNALREASRFDEALPKVKEAVEFRRELLGEAHPQTAIAMADQAKILEAKGDYEGSLASNRRALAILEETLGAEHPQVGYAVASLAYTLGELFKHDEAVELEKRALAIFQRSLGDAHPRVAKTLSNLGNSLAHAGRFDDAVAALKRSIEVTTQIFGPDHPDVATPMLVLAQLYVQSARNEQALQYAEQGLTILEAAAAADAQVNKGHLSSAYAVVSNLYANLGRDEDAVAAALKMLETDRAVHGDDHEEVAMARLNLGTIYGLQRKFERSREQLEAALPILRTRLGPDHPYVPMTLNNLSSVYRETGEHDKAIAAAKEALALKKKRGDVDPRDVAITEYNIGDTYLQAGDLAEAVRWLDQSNTSYGNVEHVDPAQLGDVRFALADALRRSGRERARALDLALLAREVYREVPRTLAEREIERIEAWLARHYPQRPRL